MPKDLKHTEASFSPISTNLLCLRVAQIPISPDLVIFVVTTDDRQTKPIALPLVHAHGVKINHDHIKLLLITQLAKTSHKVI